MLNLLNPEEIDSLTGQLLADVGRADLPQAALAEFIDNVETFRHGWGVAFARFGRGLAGELAYQDLLLDFREKIVPVVNRHLHEDSQYAAEKILCFLEPPADERKRLDQHLLQLRARVFRAAANNAASVPPPEFDRPVFIVSAPRSGSTLLFETLSRFPELWTIGMESHEVVEGIPALHPAAHGYGSNCLGAADATPEAAASLRERFTRQLRDHDGQTYVSLPPGMRPAAVRFLEKTPKNALRIPFLKAAFPGARFLFLYREPCGNISSMLEGWRARRFSFYSRLPGWPHRTWCFMLIPGWRELHSRPLVEIAARQWRFTNERILDDLQQLPASDWLRVNYADLIQEPGKTVRDIARFADWRWHDNVDQHVADTLPVSSMTLSTPHPEKWRKHADELELVLPGLDSLVARIEAGQEGA